MRKLRFFLAEDLAVDQQLTLTPELSHQMLNVLRLKISDDIYLFNDSGAEFKATISNVAKKSATITILSSTDTSVESPCQINLGQVLGKGEKMDVVIQKATELGVHSITPLFSEHSVIKKLNNRINTKQEHWQKIANAACSQCGRNIIPTIHPAQDLTNWISNNTNPLKLLLSPSDTAKKIKDLTLQSPLSILIGPEGGFSAEEIALAGKHDFLHVSLGPRILRTETAGIAVIAIVQSLLGDL